MKTAIKTVQPYKLYKKIVSAKRRTILSKLGQIILLIIVLFINYDKDDIPFLLMMIATLLFLGAPMTLYDYRLKSKYEPGVSYSWVRDYANGRIPHSLNNNLIIIGVIWMFISFICDILDDSFPITTIFFVIGWSLLFFGIKFFFKKMMNKEDRIRIKNHQDIDYNVNIDLKDIYGVNDKMTLSYQNFDYKQKDLQKGNYILGISPLGVYFAHKVDSVIKTFIKFEDIDTLGLVQTIGNIFIFNIKSKSNVEINIIIDPDDSLVVSQYKLAETLLNTLDSFITNGRKGSAFSTRRRRITVSPSTADSSINKPEKKVVNAGRVIDIDVSSNSIENKPSTNDKRIVNITFTPTVISELASGEMITSNRQIEI